MCGRSCHVFDNCYFPLAQQVTAHFFWDEIPTGTEGFVFMWQHSGAQGHAMWLQPGRGDAVAYTPLKNPIKKRKKEMVFIHGMTWTYICVRPWITLFLMLLYCTHRRACTPNTTITTTSVNFKKLKGDWGNMSLTRLLGNVCVLCSDSSVTFSYVIWNSNQLPSVTLRKISHFMPLSCCWLLVCKVSSSAWGNC